MMNYGREKNMIRASDKIKKGEPRLCRDFNKTVTRNPFNLACFNINQCLSRLQEACNN